MENGILTSQERLDISGGLKFEPYGSSLEKGVGALSPSYHVMSLLPRKQPSGLGSSTPWASQEIARTFTH